MRHTSWIFIIMLLSCAASARGETAFFVSRSSSAAGLAPDYTAQMTQLRGDSALSGSPTVAENSNFGGLTQMSLGCEATILSRLLFRFPVTSLAGKYSRLTRARMVCTLASKPVHGPNNPTIPDPLHFELYSVAPANAAWLEGNGVRAPVSGAACWAWRAYPATPWLGSMGCGTPGVDFTSAPISSSTLTGQSWPVGQQLIFEFNDLTVLEDWIAHPERNGGVLLRSSTLESLASAQNLVYLQFQSDAVASELSRPRLEVDYDPLLPPSLTLAPFQAGVAALKPDPAYDTQATSLFSGDDNVYGASGELTVGVQSQAGSSRQWRSLLKFDLAQMLGHTHAVRAMRLILTVKALRMDDAVLAHLHQLQLDRVAPANAAWSEGAATWLSLAQGQLPWAGGSVTGAGLQVAGLDYLAPPLDQVVFNPSALHDGDTLAFDITDAWFTWQWILHPETNGGLRLSSPSLESAGAAAASSNGQIVFYSDDAAQPSQRPRLELYYDAQAVDTSADPGWLRLR